MEISTSNNGQIELTIFWGHLFNFYCDLWRDRCYYMDLLQRKLEEQDLNTEIERVLKRDWTALHRRDRELQNQVSENTASTAHKKVWLFQVECAFEFAQLSLDSKQRNIFDFGFAVFDPV